MGSISNFYVDLRGIDNVTILTLATHEQAVFLHLLRCSSISLSNDFLSFFLVFWFFGFSCMEVVHLVSDLSQNNLYLFMLL